MKNNICFSKKNIYLFGGILIFSVVLIVITHLLVVTKKQLSTRASMGPAKMLPKPNSIVGGHAAERGEWPFMVALFDKRQFRLKSNGYHPQTYTKQEIVSNDTSQDLSEINTCLNQAGDCVSNVYYRTYCAGILIDRYWVITAAHCLTDLHKEEIGIAGGFYDLKNDVIDWKKTILSDVDKEIIHENYSHYVTDNNDIALVKLKVPFNLPTLSFSDNEKLYQYGNKAYVLGWGFINAKIYSDLYGIFTFYTAPPNILQEGLVTLVSPLVITPFPPQSIIDYNYLTTFDTTILTFSGDSGGPLVTFDAARNKYYLIGIIDKGQSNKSTNGNIKTELPNGGSYYTNVKRHVEWIVTTTAKENMSVQQDRGTFVGTPPM